MASDTIFRSNSCEERWRNRVQNHIRSTTIDIGKIRECIFQVPKIVRATKPEAYAPNQIGLGPYHHFQPHLYKREWQHIAATKRILERSNNSSNYYSPFTSQLDGFEFVIRAFYDKYLDFEEATLVKEVEIDSFFLLDHLGTYNVDTIVDSQMRKLARDIMILENQIPLILVTTIQKGHQNQRSFDFTQEIIKSLNKSPVEPEFSPGVDKLMGNMVAFCEKHSPLKLRRQREFWYLAESWHLLDFMYNLIVHNQKILYTNESASSYIRENEEVLNAIEQLLHMAGMQKCQKIFTLIKNAPWDMILALFKRSVKFPSVSELSSTGKVKFAHMLKGISDINFKEKNVTFYLPEITLNLESEVILRNLLAYEAAMGYEELGDYMGLMCGIIDSSEDVELLRESGVLKGDLSNDEIVDVFNGMSKLTWDPSRMPHKVMDKVTKHYNKRWIKVKACLFMKNCANAVWKFIVFLCTVLVFVPLIVTTFCEVFNCSSYYSSSQSSS